MLVVAPHAFAMRSLRLAKRIIVYPGAMFPNHTLALWDGKVCAVMYCLVKPFQVLLSIPVPVILEPLRLKSN